MPVGGLGHRILVGQILFGESYDRGFGGACRISSALAALAALREDVWSLLLAVTRKDGERRRVGAMLLVSAVTAAFISFPFQDAYLGISGNLLAVVGVLLLVSGLLLYVAEELGRRTRSLVSLNPAGALFIGLLQVLAVLPGISRTGMAISGGMLVGITRDAATRFALLLSIPLLLVAGVVGPLGRPEFSRGVGGHNRHVGLFRGGVSGDRVSPVVRAGVLVYGLRLLFVDYRGCGHRLRYFGVTLR